MDQTDQSPPNKTATANKKKRGRPPTFSRPEVVYTPEMLLNSTAIHTVGLGITGPPPPNSLVEVGKFSQVLTLLERTIEDKLASTSMDYTSVDIDVSGLRYRPPEVEVSEAILEAASRYETADMGAEEFVSGQKIPDFQTLIQREAEAQLRSMDHIKFVRKVINKVRNKNVNYMSKGMEEKSIDVKPLSPDDVLLSVALYPCHSMSMIQEYLVLGRQKLTELKDVLYCLQDESVENNEVDTAPSAIVSTKNTSGFFFFGDTFYNDTRLATNADYATPIIEFIDQGRSPYWSLFAPFKATVMENTTFNDLTLQVGKKYLYCHRARCEHIIVVTAIRQILPSDDQNANAYPKQIYQSKHRQRKCTICDRTVAKWITTDDTFSIENPSYYCAECFDMAHRHHNGSLNNTGFKLLPYLHD